MALSSLGRGAPGLRAIAARHEPEKKDMGGKKKKSGVFPQDLIRFPLSGGEVHYLWWFIQGSIMNPSTRYQLRDAWGLCERHAWGAIQAETSFRHGYMHGPAILYEDILGSAVQGLHLRGVMKDLRLLKNLRNKGPCLMCEMDLGPETKGAANPDIVERGRDPGQLQIFARSTEPYWKKAVCGQCLGNGSWPRCRRHLLDDARRGNMGSLLPHQDLLNDIFRQITLYSLSFRWEFHGTETEEGKAALLSAVGWCSGWEPLLSILEMEK